MTGQTASWLGRRATARSDRRSVAWLGPLRAACRVAVLSAVVAALALPAQAQDTHYWNNQYGPRAMLLGGTIVGSVHDMSATYYSPGALGYIAEPELLLSANVYQNVTLTARDGAGEGIDLQSSDFRPIPNMVAGAFRFSWLGPNKLAYAVLTRHRFDTEVRIASVGRQDVLEDQPGEEEFAAAAFSSAEAKETWVGGSWANHFGPRIGIGVSPFLTIRSSSREEQLFAQAMPDSGGFALLYELERHELKTYGLLAKVGIGIDLDPVTLGLTLTTPTLQLAGSGEAVTNLTIAGIDPDSTGSSEGRFEANLQQDVSGNHNSPLSLAFGGAYGLGETRVNLTVEWFGEVEPYDVLELEPFTSQATGEIVQPTVKDARKSVTNWGVGLEHGFTERTHGYMSFITDRSAASPDSDVGVTRYDIYHVAGGLSFTVKRSVFTLGLAYAWGTEDIDRLIDLEPEDGTLVRPEDQATLEYRRITFVLGFSVKL